MIEAKGIVKSFGASDNRQTVLKGINISVDDGDNVVILGASGSGKSTLLNVLSGLERVDEGKIFYGDREIALLNDKELTVFRREYIGFVFQQYYLLPDMTVDKNVRMGADLAGNKNYKEIIESLGLGDKLNKYPRQLSGGEQQRVAVARALAKIPKVLFMDEPTGALDESTGRQLLDYVLKLQSMSGFTLITVTHNENIAQTANTVIRLNSGAVVDTFRNQSPKSAYEIGW